jgi:AmmeMemoRadiSam system protein B
VTAPARRTRPAAVAGTFYPADPHQLALLVEACFADSVAPPADAPAPDALVVPHAGLVYSGPIAASAYRRLVPVADRIERVVLLGPSHRVAFRGMALPGADAFATPLGPVAVDTAAVAGCLDVPATMIDDRPHAHEHSLEVQLPFLRTVVPQASLVPVVVGDADPAEVAALLERFWDDPATVVVISTDLSHYHGYDEAQRLDRRTAAAIVAARPADIGDLDACGSRPLRGLLRTVAGRHLHVEQLDLRNSGDTAGDRDRVVGYGAFAVA